MENNKSYFMHCAKDATQKESPIVASISTTIHKKQNRGINIHKQAYLTNSEA